MNPKPYNQPSFNEKGIEVLRRLRVVPLARLAGRSRGEEEENESTRKPEGEAPETPALAMKSENSRPQEKGKGSKDAVRFVVPRVCRRKASPFASGGRGKKETKNVPRCP